MADTSEGLGMDEEHKVSRSPITKLRIAVTRPVLRQTAWHDAGIADGCH